MLSRFLKPGLAVLALWAGNVPAQAPAAPPAAAAAPAVAPYVSALDGYQPFRAEAPASWKDANDTVRQIGGWRAYAREAARGEAAPAGSGPAAGGAAAPAPADPHAGHRKP